MNHPVTTPETLAALEANAQLIAEFYARIPDALLFTGDPEHWGPAHHLIHLTRTSAAIARGLRSGSLRPQATARSRNYAEVRDAATGALGATPKDRLLEMGRVVVIPEGASRVDVVAAFTAASAELRAAAATWTEEALDRHAIPHPLMGPLTVREMLLFCVVHERHHLKLVRTRTEPRTLAP
jgi:hypothetical protein